MKTREAIERVQSRFDKWALDEEDLEALRTLGLVAESEDERIRKNLISFINLNKNSMFSQKERNEFINYLEKQKEQQPAMIQWTGKNLKEIIDFTGKSPRFGEWFKSWNEYESYVHSHNDILKLFCEDGSHYEVPVGAWIVKTPDGYNVPSQSRFVWHHAEWSEGTKKALDEISDYLKYKGREEDADFIKHLRPTPKQEWSEEDESHLIHTIHLIEDVSEWAKKDGMHGYCVAICDEILPWLKSLRPQPHWKPTEEQMGALMLAIEGKCSPTSYMSHRLEELRDGLVNTFKVGCKLEI